MVHGSPSAAAHQQFSALPPTSVTVQCLHCAERPIWQPASKRINTEA